MIVWWRSNTYFWLRYNMKKIWLKDLNSFVHEWNWRNTRVFSHICTTFNKKTLPGGWLLINILYFKQQLYNLITEFIVINKRSHSWLCLWLDDPFNIIHSLLLTKTPAIRSWTTNCGAILNCINQFSFLADNLQHGKSIQLVLVAKCWKR